MSGDTLLGRAKKLARSGFSWLAARGPHMSHRLTGYLLVFMVLAGVVLRIQNVGYPFHFCFDEHQYAPAAHQFLVGIPDTAECCHPPFSKLIIGVGLLLFGNNPMGWRYMPLCFGIQNIVLVYLIANSLFQDRRAGWLAAAFMAGDGFCLAYSRASLPDIILASFVLWSMLAAVTARGWGGVLACALLVGGATSIKWVGLLVGFPACLAILLLKRAPWYSLICFGVVPVVHVAIWMLGFHLIGHENGPMAVWDEIRRRQDIHLGFIHFINPLESAWYTWLVLYHPLLIKSANVGAKVRLASSIGNPLLMVTAHLCLLALPLLGGVVALNARFRQKWLNVFDARTSKALLIVGASWLSMMALWMTGRISTYWYHYLTPWSFAIILVGGIVGALDRRFPKIVLAFVFFVLAISSFFAPVWAELPIAPSLANHRLIFPMWR